MPPEQHKAVRTVESWVLQLVMMFLVGAILGWANASARTGSPGVIATDPALSTHTAPSVLTCVLVRMMLTATPATGRAPAPRGGSAPTAPSPARRASMARTASTTVTARMGQSVIRRRANVIVLPGGVEYSATLGVRRDYSGRIARRSVTA